MAATLVGGAFLSGTLQTILDSITSTEFRQYFTNRNLNVSLLDELHTTLLTLNAVLDDAEEKQVTNPAVKEWLDKLQDAVFDTEDLLDQVSTDSLRCKVEESRPQSMKNQVWTFLSYPCDQFDRDVNSKVDNTSRKLLSFEKQKDILGLRVARGRVSCRKPTCSLVNESIIVGGSEEKEELMKMLVCDEDASYDDVGVVIIFGMGGVGKTTLVQLVYNNKQVQEHFDLKAWACVSQDFDVVSVTKTLLESVTSKVYDSNNLDFLRVELKQRLNGKKFLFVLDDLWNEKYSDWDDLRIPFGDGKVGSKVIITTRQQRVAEVTHIFPIYKLEPLADEECWSLLAKHAFGSGNHLSTYPNLQVVGMKIAKKCDGLPIAAKTLGGLLRSKVDPKEWERVLSSNIWDSPNDDVLPALRLSYLHLPAHLKRCFAYCSIFPKGYPLDRKQLVLLWMAEGLIQQPQGERTIEERGDAYFMELLSRSLIQHLEDGSGEMFVMHDLVNDLARVISAKCSFRIECGEIPETIRHVSYNQECHDHSKRFEDLHKLKYLRSFIPLSSKGWTSYLARNVLEDLLPKLRWLRVLSLSKYKNITMLPNSIGSLVHLRYLDLSHTEIKRLPDPACKLYNLQSLILTECHILTQLPEDIDKLLSLRYLDVSGTNLKHMPMQIGGLQNLQSLTTFVVSRQEEGSKVRELRKFPHLLGKLSILGLQNVVDAMDAFDANLKCKERIEELMFEWGKYTEDSKFEKDVLEQLQPSKNLRKLTISSYSGTSFPSWIGDHSYYNMVSICISNCEYCISLPPLGQLPCLKELFILGIKLETVGPDLYGKTEGGSYSVEPFPSLQHLKFEDMPNWKEWLLPLASEGNHFGFPHLKSLCLLKCPKLKGHLPNHLPSLTRVEILGCYQLSARIQHSDSLAALPKMILSSDCLLALNLCSIPSLIAFPASGLPTSLRSLHISYCETLAFLPLETWCNYTSLVTLKIWYSCDSLVSFYLNCFPALESASLGGCTNLQSLCISEASAQHSSRLRSVHLDYCKALRSLPENMDTLTALESLSMSRLPNLESFPQGGLSPNLQSLFVYDCGRVSHLGIANWDLQQHTALSSVHIEGKCNALVKALLKEALLPITLVSLTIYSPDMKLLEGDRLRHLTSLKMLRILSSPKLKSLPREGLQHLTSLKELGIHGCPLLKSLPEDTLPPSLSLLRITKCPMLEERYKNQKGEHWSKIAHIPVIEINELVII